MEKKIEKELNKQPYTNHPPHLTIIHSNINEYKAAINEIKECLKGLKSFKMTVHKNNIFWDFVNRIYLIIKKNEYLNFKKKLSVVFIKKIMKS